MEAGIGLSVSPGTAAFLVALSLGVGVLGGFVGLALGTLRLPALLLLGVPPPVAAGTNIFVSMVSAGGGALRHLREGRVDLRMAASMGLPSVAGAFLGGFFGGRAPADLLTGLAGAVVVWQGAQMVARARRVAPAPEGSAPGGPPGGPRGQARWGVEAGVGLSIGLLGGAVGLILGTLRLPALVNLLRVPPHTAVGTNLAIGFLLGLAGFIGHGLQREVDPLLAVAMGLAGALGSSLGARLTGRARPRTLLGAIGGVLLVVGLVLLVNALGGRP